MKKTKLMSLSVLLLSLGLAGCGEKDEGPKYESDKTYHWVLDAEGNVDKDSKVKHDFEEDASKGKAAKCTEKGTKVEVCKTCGYEKTSDVSATGHSYTVQSNTPATCSTAGSKVEKCSVCNDVKTTPLPKTDHTYAAATDGTHTNTTATCSVEGKHWEKCSGCNDWKEVNDGYADHTWGAYSSDVVVEGNTKYKKRTCSACSSVDVTISALDWVNINGSNKDTTGATLKLNTNGNYVEYKFNLGGAFTGKVYLYGWVDRVGGSDNNETKGFFTVKNSENTDGNFAISVNTENPITITNKSTYAEMGMTGSGIKVTDAGVVSDSGYERANPVLCEVGDIAIPAGDATIKYARVDSYNLNISEIHFIGKIA